MHQEGLDRWSGPSVVLDVRYQLTIWRLEMQRWPVFSPETVTHCGRTFMKVIAFSWRVAAAHSCHGCSALRVAKLGVEAGAAPRRWDAQVSSFARIDFREAMRALSFAFSRSDPGKSSLFRGRLVVDRQ